ncbi:MAG: haloacid dehalogenase type II [Zetaproteobacteria bacterium]|nr:MAG: haloacid dehalogenase type II [Zetaproteobacteria bacterium]
MRVHALLFDVFGTVVDWRGSVVRAGQRLGRGRPWDIDWGEFADLWRREGYLEPTAQIARGERPWERVDVLHRRKLDELVVRFGLAGLSEAETGDFNQVWRRLDPWPDVVQGLHRLRKRFLVAPLSNGDFALLTNMAKHAGLPWDCIVSTELFKRFKPDPQVYRDAVDLLGLDINATMMVSAHPRDLEGARSAGRRAAYIDRPLEFGPASRPKTTPGSPYEVSAADLADLADKLGA